MEEMSSLIPHVFLPMKVPVTSENILQEERYLLETFQNFLSNQDLNEIKISRRVVNAFEVWKTVQDNSDDGLLAKTIGDLTPGEILPLYIRSQNAGVILSIPEINCCDNPDSVVISTFPASQKSADVIAAPGDLACAFPEKSVHVPRSHLLASETLARQLIALNGSLIEDAMSKTNVSNVQRGNDRDVPDPKYVSKWICSSLCSTDSCLCNAFPRIIKKVRDEVVVGSKGGTPFRRSGLWMMAKATLQLILTCELGSVAGKHLYKLLMLEFLCTFCRLEFLQADEGVQILAKIGRRYLKLIQIGEFFDNNLLIRIGGIVEMAVGDLRRRLDEQWKVKIDTEYKMATLNLQGNFNFIQDKRHELKNACAKLNARNASIVEPNENVKIAVQVGPKRNWSTSCFVQMDSFGVSGVVLCDFERNVLAWHKFVCVQDCEHIRKFFISYLNNSSGYYKDDPVGISRMVLTCLKMIQVIDRTVCEEYPMLLEHNHNVPIEIVEHLMLPFKSDMKLACELEKYFKSRTAQASFPGLLEKGVPAGDCYSVRHSTSNSDMQNKLWKILEEGERKATDKQKVVEKHKCIWEIANKLIQVVQCTCTFSWDKNCGRCQMEKIANDMKVDAYMYPLPLCPFAQNAIVFELLIPTPIACLRDVLAAFLTHLKILSITSGIETTWSAHSQLASHSHRSTWNVKMGSKDMPIEMTHFKRHHPKEPIQTFLVENNCNTALCIDQKFLNLLDKIPESVLRQFVFKVQPGSPYAGLQWTLDDHDYKHSQNSILARQQECPQNLKLSEFIEFGTMRAGHRIQLRNLYRALKAGTLSLREESVFALICQVLWRAGPNSNLATFVRESHEDLLCEEFVSEFLSLLSIMIDSYSKNWDDHLALLTVIVILLRIYSINSVTRILHRCFELLSKCRRIILEWCSDIEQILGGLANKSVKEQNNIRRKLLEVASCCSLTYWADVTEEKKYLVNDVKTWLLSIKTLSENIIMSSKNVATHPNTLRNQLRRVQECGIANENLVHEVLRSKPTEMDGFMRAAWAGAKQINKSTFVSWTSCQEYPQVYEASPIVDDSPTILHVDIISGRFHVNGKPVGFLPQNLMLHEDYKRLFGSHIFEVQSLKQSPWSVISKYKYRNSDIKFAIKGDLFVITEVRPDGNEFEYVPNTVFEDQLPHDLIENYAHWWNKQEEVIVFRSLTSEDNVEAYCLDLNTGLISETVTGRHVIDIKSQSYKLLLEIFRRLEHEHFISIFLPKQDESCKRDTLDVVLPRMRLSFTARLSSSKLSISSLEYPNMQVAEHQHCGTLIGLRNGLILEPGNDRNTKKVLLMPHGTVKIYKELVAIDTANLRQPPYCAYEVDARLQLLRTGQMISASTYLAYLHAVTSHPLPDPFTGHTGTERALQILQSGHCFSCEPFDAEAASTLERIGKLSPMRKYYSVAKKMTQVEWPMTYSVCCSDAFQIVAKTLVSESNRLAALSPEISTSTVEFDSEHNLCVRSYWRHFKITTDQCHIEENFLALTHPPIRLVSKFDYDFSTVNVERVMILACLCNKWISALYCFNNLHSMLTSSTLDGISNKGFPFKETVVVWLSLDFRNSWLDLYQLARKASSSGLQSEWALILCCFAFMGLPEEHLILLQTVAVHHAHFASINPPPYTVYSCPNSYSFDGREIESTIRDCAIGFESYLIANEDLRSPSDETLLEFEERMRAVFVKDVNREAHQLTAEILRLWPSRTCDQVVKGYTGNSEKLLNLEKVIKKVNPIMENWFHNLQLKVFLDKVKKMVIALGGSEFSTSGVSQRLAESMREQNSFAAGRLIELKLSKMKLGCSTTGYERARITFSRGTIEGMELLNMIPDPGTLQKLCKSSTHGNVESLLTDPNNDSSCEIWSELVSSLRVSENDNVPEKSNLLAYGTRNGLEMLKSYFGTLSKISKTESENFFKLATSPLMTNPLIKILVVTGIFPRLTPLTLLQLLAAWRGKILPTQKWLHDAIGAFGVAETCSQYATRCLEYIESNSQVELQRELDNVPHKNWNPSERPEWLLFEIEMDLAVRSIQKEVAEQMENQEGNMNAVMQLNMGEGKTAVITPLLLLRLADGNQLCRLTVLKSLYNINRQALRQNLGGLLLNRRIYSFPCRRDCKIPGSVFEQLFEVYQECCQRGDICITTPEYRLSFELMAYEQCRSKKHKEAKALLEIQQWLRRNVRDILDECDEILQVKYQLIYTLGAQIKLDGGSHRWTILQSLLDIIPDVIDEIKGVSEDGSVELFKNGIPKGCFRPCRLLKEEVYNQFCKALADRIVDGVDESMTIVFPVLGDIQKKTLRKFLTDELVDKDIFDEVKNFLKSHSTTLFQETALILRGLMACGILFASFNKRWRVNYGVNPVGSSPLAVPFRAKDVAAERTEFGHPDVALLLTHLSYYYSGLSDSQVDECLARVRREPDPEREYGRIIDTLDNPHPSIASLKGINMHDYKQRTEYLYPALRKNKAFIDYWLANIILPVKAKQFPFKIICSSWDLASDRTCNLTTGFSGTNDTRLLLPLTVVQGDLPKLKSTNADVVSILLLEENNSYRSLLGNITAKQILEELVAADIPLLLDVGAVMLELDNEGVAREWLQLTDSDKIDAAIYFSANNLLMVKDRSTLDPVQFEISPFRDRLTKCIIYLDDVHTRGTDLKIPSSTMGCVTLGKGVGKDKLVQGCMRMRKLGKGHTVCFWASSEVHNEIVALVGKRAVCGTADVLKWALNNSRNAIRDGFPHMVAATSSYIRKSAAQDTYEVSGKTDHDRFLLADMVSQPETMSLLEMYGQPWEKTTFPSVADMQLRKCCDAVDAAESLRVYHSRVVKRCQKYVPQLMKNIHLLDEEQERELEHELEEEREVFRPRKEKPHEPYLHPDILQFLRDSKNELARGTVPEWAMLLSDGIQTTSVEKHNEVNAWGDRILITKDFFRTIVTQRRTDPKDSFLRPVNWIVTFDVDSSQHWLLMSPFEVNQLIPEFRAGRLRASLHMYSARLSPKQSTLLELGTLVLPPTRPEHLLTKRTGFHKLNTSLSIFAGCTFFGNQAEVVSFTDITGYAPNPRTCEERLAFEQGLMDNTGFLRPRKREQLRPNCMFQKNPERLIAGIIRCRYDHFPKSSDVWKIVYESSTPRFEAE